MLRQRKKAIKAVAISLFISCVRSMFTLAGTNIFTHFEVMFFWGRSQAKNSELGIVFMFDRRIEDCGVGGSVIT